MSHQKPAKHADVQQISYSMILSAQRLEERRKAKAGKLATVKSQTAKAALAFLLEGEDWFASLPPLAYREDGSRCFLWSRTESERNAEVLWIIGKETREPWNVPRSRAMFEANDWLQATQSHEPIAMLLGPRWQSELMLQAARALAVAARRERVSALPALRMEFELQRPREVPDIAILDAYRDAVLLAVEVQICVKPRIGDPAPPVAKPWGKEQSSPNKLNPESLAAKALSELAAQGGRLKRAVLMNRVCPPSAARHKAIRKQLSSQLGPKGDLIKRGWVTIYKERVCITKDGRDAISDT
jgi:hypothetical protein